MRSASPPLRQSAHVNWLSGLVDVSETGASHPLGRGTDAARAVPVRL